MGTAEDLLFSLRTRGRQPAAELLERLKVSRATLTRSVRALGDQVVARGSARRSAYAARRAVRGQGAPLPLWRITENGRAVPLGELLPLHPQGCVADLPSDFTWPRDPDMRDGWFDGVPYFMDDMRPQGFMGRQFAQRVAHMLQVGEDPRHWSEDDVLHALALLGSDQPGDLLLGEPAHRLWLAAQQSPEPPLTSRQLKAAYAQRAEAALQAGVPGSSAGGEFPKFSALREGELGEPCHVLVKFSGSDASPGSLRWSDLLVCEHLALQAMAQHLGVAAARSRIIQHAQRCFLEVERFDRHGAFGRSPLCSWFALNAAFFGLAGRPWTEGAAALRQAGWLDDETQQAIQRIWHFGRLIANTDMHDGNLSFRPGLRLAPAYDMLPMLYAPLRGVEVPTPAFVPPLPLPSELEAWRGAQGAAERFWAAAAADRRISAEFRAVCERNAQTVRALAHSAPGG
jgi:hypothetical protein